MRAVPKLCCSFIAQQRVDGVDGAKCLALKPGQKQTDKQSYSDADYRIGCEAAAYSSEPVSPAVQIQHISHRNVGGSDQKREGGCGQRIVLPDRLESKSNRTRVGDRLKKEFPQQGKRKGPWGMGHHHQAERKKAA